MTAGEPQATLLLLVTEDWYLASHRLPIVRAAVAAGFRVIAATRVREHGAIITAAGAEVVPITLAREGRNPWGELAAIRELTRLYRVYRPSVVHHVGVKPILHGGWAARASGVPAVVQGFAGLGTMYVSPDQQRVKRAVFEALVRPVTNRDRTTVLVQNEADAATMIARRLALPDRVRVIRGSGVDLTRFLPTPEPAGVPVVMMPSRILRDKGAREFVEAARLLRGKARFVLVGAADHANPSAIPGTEINGWTADGTVELWGHRADMPEVLSQANLVVLPSYREGLPKALLEAAAAGRAIVTIQAPGCQDVVTDGVNGLLVPVRDPSTLAAAINALLVDPARRLAMGIAGRARVEHEFSDRAIAAAHIDLYLSVLQ